MTKNRGVYPHFISYALYFPIKIERERQTEQENYLSQNSNYLWGERHGKKGVAIMFCLISFCSSQNFYFYTFVAF